MSIEELAKQITQWVAIHAWRESAFLYPEPSWNVNAHSLLDFVQEITGISKEQIDKWTQEAEEIVETPL